MNLKLLTVVLCVRRINVIRIIIKQDKKDYAVKRTNIQMVLYVKMLITLFLNVYNTILVKSVLNALINITYKGKSVV